MTTLLQIRTRKELFKHIQKKNCLNLTVYAVDVSTLRFSSSLKGSIFVGCRFESLEQKHEIEKLGAVVFPAFQDIPYTPFRNKLYTCEELLEGSKTGGYTKTKDFEIYKHFDQSRRGQVPLLEALSQRIHDHAIDDALHKFVDGSNGIVAIMGGHGTKRNNPWYRKVARISWMLTRKKYLIASGGGPGIMEAANLGAFLANFKNIEVVDAAIKMLSKFPKFDGGEKEGSQAYLDAISNYVKIAEQVRKRSTQKSFDKFGRQRKSPGQSIAIPTWFYGHEPTNLFCDNVAKYFSNGIREDTLLAIAKSGVIFAPGSAGTLQEVFMDLAQNHYATFVERSPMVFLSKTHFASTYGLLRNFVSERGTQNLYGDLIDMFDEEDDIVKFIVDNPPRPRKENRPLYEFI